MKMHLFHRAQEELYTLQYFLLEDGGYYGIAVESRCGHIKNSVYCYRISEQRERVSELLGKAARGKLFPCSLPGVVEDFLYELNEA